MPHETDLVEVVCLHCGTVSTTHVRPEPDDHSELWHPADGLVPPGVCPGCGTPFALDEPAFDVLTR
jgi:hypothetical protein